MKRTLIPKEVGLALALGTFLTTAANATLVDFNWVPDSLLRTMNIPSSGTLTYDTTSSTVTSFSWLWDSKTANNSFTGTATVLGDGDLQLVGPSTGGTSGNVTWAASILYGNENQASVGQGILGDWVPAAVPEPTTMIAGAGALGLALFGIGRARRPSVVRIGK